ncbi:hypothetical protein KA977_08775, partial [Candidatus Dependentiae bacterium]|nr:hypothetical protein [Candidatus Dependentiae bacterium]
SYTAVNFELFDFNTSNHISGLSEAFNNLKLKYRLPSGVNKFNGRLFAIFQYNEELRQWHQISPSYQYNILSGIEVEIQISHFSIYGLFAIPYFEQSGDVEIYPNPFIAGDRNFKTGRNYTGTDDGSGIYFAGSNLKNANVKIVNLAGYVVNEFNTGGESYFQWDVFDRKGRPVSSGLYYVIIETGNYKCVKKLQIIR